MGLHSFAGFANTDVSATFGSPTPEPSTLLMLGGGVLGLAGILRRKMNL